MRVLHLRYSSNVYGAEKMIMLLCREQVRSGLDICLAAFEKLNSNSLSRSALSEGIRTERITSYSKLDTGAIRQLYSHINSFKPDIIHSHGYKTDIISYILKRFFIRLDVRLITTIHGWTSSSKNVAIYEKLDRFLIRGFDRIVAVSHRTGQNLIDSGVPGNKIRIVRNAIDVAEFKNVTEAGLKTCLGIEDERKIVSFIGRLSPEKGIMEFLEMSRRLRDAGKMTAFLVVGDGPLIDSVREYIQTNGLEGRVYLLGRREDVREILASSDILVIPSLTEGIPVVLLEAMASGTPVVASNTGGIPEVVSDGVSAMLVEVKDIDGLAERVTELIKNPDLRNRIVNEARLTVEESYDSRVMAVSYSNIYREALAS